MASEPDDLYENARANKQIYDKITSFPDAKLGFVVYRCTYSSNADWEQFMAYLDARMRYKLERGGIADLAHRLDWCVQQDPRLEDASEEEVRRRFRIWLQETGERDHATSRHRACIMVDGNAVQWAVHKRPMAPDERDGFGILCVTLVSIRDEDPESDEEEDFEFYDPKKSPEENAETGNEDGETELVTPHPKRDKVSTELVCISDLLSVWATLDGPGWSGIENERRLNYG